MSTRLHTPLCDLLGIRAPILLAGMAQGPSTPELVAAVTRAGGSYTRAGAVTATVVFTQGVASPLFGRLGDRLSRRRGAPSARGADGCSQPP